MSPVAITNQSLAKLESTSKPYFLRDNQIKGFGVKVNPSGSIKYVVDVWHDGSSNRKTVGEYPFLDVKEARLKAQTLIAQIKSGALQQALKERIDF